MLVAVSLMASFMSSISILGGDAEVFNYGTHFYTINIGCQIGILIAMECYVPVFLKLESVSMYQRKFYEMEGGRWDCDEGTDRQYLELRFGKTLRIFSSLAFVVQMLLYMSIVLVAPSIALQIITKMPYVSCIIIVGFVSSGYAYFGGFWKIFEIARESGRIDFGKSGKILKTDQILPLYVIENFNTPGLKGLFVAGIFSAALSTISPLLNSLAAVTVEDYFKPIYFRVKGEKFMPTTSITSQIFSLTYGFLCIIIALLTLNMRSILTGAIVVFNVVGGPILAMFSLGIFIPFANQWET
ncbi:hypothetical protein U1Q18_045056 [Sarracenia purpurea var. burkii]